MVEETADADDELAICGGLVHLLPGRAPQPLVVVVAATIVLDFHQINLGEEEELGEKFDSQSHTF